MGEINQIYIYTSAFVKWTCLTIRDFNHWHGRRGMTRCTARTRVECSGAEPAFFAFSVLMDALGAVDTIDTVDANTYNRWMFLYFSRIFNSSCSSSVSSSLLKYIYEWRQIFIFSRSISQHCTIFFKESKSSTNFVRLLIWFRFLPSVGRNRVSLGLKWEEIKAKIFNKFDKKSSDDLLTLNNSLPEFVNIDHLVRW